MNIQEKPNNAIIISVSSEIGAEMAKRWVSRGSQIIGTYRTETTSIQCLSEIGVKLIKCDLSNDESVKSAAFAERHMLTPPNDQTAREVFVDLFQVNS